jgi:hypothetical protein
MGMGETTVVGQRDDKKEWGMGDRRVLGTRT